MAPLRRPGAILAIIVVAQLLSTAQWFVGNAVVADLSPAFGLSASAASTLITVVQLGFICGTAVFAVLGIADRFLPTRVFFSCALASAAANLWIVVAAQHPWELMTLRFLTGFFLAGIYPVGMKIAADHFEQGLGRALGWLLGALVMGKALPHGLKYLTMGLSWKVVFGLTIGLTLLGGSLIRWAIADGPYRRPAARLQLGQALASFRDPDFRAAAGGYFGHMWELYAFWAFVPFALSHYQQLRGTTLFSIPGGAFVVIAMGSLGCVGAGYLAKRWGPARVAQLALILSGSCCLLSPWFYQLPEYVFLALLLLWGLTVIADSPMFSTLIAHHAPSVWRGSSLTMVNALGFGLTVISIPFLQWLQTQINPRYLFWGLVLGPLLGLVALRPLAKRPQSTT